MKGRSRCLLDGPQLRSRSCRRSLEHPLRQVQAYNHPASYVQYMYEYTAWTRQAFLAAQVQGKPWISPSVSIWRSTLVSTFPCTQTRRVRLWSYNLQIEIRKAYDTLTWSAIQSAFRRRNLPQLLADAYWRMHSRRTLKFRCATKLVRFTVPPDRGIPKGSPESPMVFAAARSGRHPHPHDGDPEEASPTL